MNIECYLFFIIVGLSLEVTVNGYVPKYVAVREQLAMTQDELRMNKWKEAIDFLETNHRRPSKFVPEERDMRNWWKHNKKLMNAGTMKEDRIVLFNQLLELGEKYKHVNQYQ